MFSIKSALNIQYELMKDASELCMPTPYQNTDNNFVLHAKNEFSLGGNRDIVIPTGIRILNFPTFTTNVANNQIVDFYVEAECKTLEFARVNYGIEVVSPTIITAFDDKEICVRLHNTTVNMFKGDVGEDIAILTFNIKPVVHLEIDMASQCTPAEMR